MRLDDLETPAYVYDLAEARQAYRALSGALPRPSTLYYSLKANPHPALVAALHEAGAHAEVCSPGELTAALDAGVPPGAVLYTGPGKRAVDLWTALKQGVRAFSVDSPQGFDDLDAAASALGVDVEALLRVNGDTLGGHRLAMTGSTSQFGADAEWVEADPAAFRSRDRVRLVGAHLYAGSNVEGQDAIAAQATAAVHTAARLQDITCTRFSLLDLGGGFAAPFARTGDLPTYPDIAVRIEAALDADFPAWRAGSPRVAFESGRHLVATCGKLLVRVLDVKISHGRYVVVLESGINHLGGMSGLRRLPPLVPDLVHPRPDGETWTDVLVTGPLCTPLDTWARSATLPACAPGDLLAVPNVGAYGLTASLLAFLGHPAPLEIVVDGDRLVSAGRLRLTREPATLTVEEHP